MKFLTIIAIILSSVNSETLIAELKPGANDYAACTGTYEPDPLGRQIQGRDFYINNKRSRILAWNGYIYVITSTYYLNSILSGAIGAGFGGFHFSSNTPTNAEDALFNAYNIVSDCAIGVVLKPGGNNYASCAGIYKIDPDGRTIFGKSFYISTKRYRILAFNGYRWVITGLQYLDGILAGSIGMGFGGFHNGNNVAEAEDASFSAYYIEKGIIKLSLIPGQNDYASNLGIYIVDDTRTIQDRAFYVNENKHNNRDGRILAFNGYRYVITAISYLDRILSGSIGKGFGGFHSSVNAPLDAIDATFNAYTLECSPEDTAAKLNDLELSCGRVLLPDNPAFNNEYLGSYKFHDDIIPDAIIYCSCESCVVSSVNYARTHDIDITIRSGRHSTGGYNKIVGRTIIDVHEINETRAELGNDGKPIFYAGPGTRTQDLLKLIDEGAYSDYIVPIGGCPTVRLGGYVGGGGASIYSRGGIGLNIDYLVSVRIVLANGQLIEATEENNYSDLFYALRGGGAGMWGIITQLKYTPTNEIPPEALWKSTMYPIYLQNPANQQWLKDFLQGASYIVEQYDIDFNMGVASAEGLIPTLAALLGIPPGQLNIPEPDLVMRIMMLYLPTTDGPNKFDRGNYIFSQFRNITEKNGLPPILPIGEIYYIESIVKIMRNRVQAFNPQDYRTNGLVTSKFIFDINTFDDTYISDEFVNDFLNDAKDTDVRVEFTLHPHANGEIYNKDPDSTITAQPNRHAIGDMSFTVTYANNANKDEAFTFAQKYSNKYLDPLSDTQFINYAENNVGSMSIDTLYPDKRVLNILKSTKTKYDPDNMFDHPLSIKPDGYVAAHKHKKIFLSNENDIDKHFDFNHDSIKGYLMGIATAAAIAFFFLAICAVIKRTTKKEKYGKYNKVMVTSASEDTSDVSDIN